MDIELVKLLARKLKDIRSFAGSGSDIIQRDGLQLEAASLRAAANQFRQAAKELDEVDGVLTAIRFMEQ